MTVTAQTPVNSYTANGVTTVFNFTFLLLASGDLDVYVDDVLKTLGVDYSVSGLEIPAGGTVTFTAAPANGANVVLQRNSDIARATDYQNNGDMLAAVVNKDFDRLWLAMQEILYKYQLAPSLVPGSPLAGEIRLPNPEVGKYLRWNAAENNLENADPGYYSGILLPSSSVINTFADLALTPAVVPGMIVFIKQHTSGNVGGGYFQDTAGTVVSDGGTKINGATSGRHWKRINERKLSIEDFGGVGDGVTSNYSVLNLIAASGFKDIYLPKDKVFFTDTAFTNIENINFYGEGRLITATDAFPGKFAIVTSPPTIVGAGLPQYFQGNSVYKANQEYYIQKTGRYGLTQPYFAAEGNPHFAIFDNRTGASGTDAHLDVDCPAGATSMTLKYTNVGFPAGTVFVMDDGLGHSQQFTSTGTSGSFVVNFTPPVSGSTFPASPGFTTVKKANRTQNVFSHVEMYHNGGGDGYGQCWRIYNGYNQATTAQYHFFQTATAGMYNGDISATANGVYLQVSETNIADLGYDVAAIGEVRSYDRTNDTGNRYAFWCDRFIKSEGTKKMDFGSVYVGKFNVVLDFGGVTDTDCIIGMKASQRIYYNNGQTIIPGNPFPIGYNTKGNIFTQADSTGTVFEIWNNSNRLRFSSSGALIAPGYVSVGTTVAVPVNGKVSLNSSNDQTYFIFDGTTVRLFKNNVQVASW